MFCANNWYINSMLFCKYLTDCLEIFARLAFQNKDKMWPINPSRKLIRITAVYFLFIARFEAAAQQIWTPAFVVNERRDTLQGEILFKDWDVSPTSIQFRNKDMLAKTYTGDEIFSFTLSEYGRVFQSKSFRTKYYETNPIGLGQSPVTREDSVNAFLEVILSSPLVTLFEFMDANRKARFFLGKDNGLHELKNVTYKITVGTSVHVKANRLYREQLKQLLFECPTLKTNNLTYDRGSLIALLRQYHLSCKIDYSVYFDKTPVFKNVHPGLAVGANSSEVGLRRFFGLTLQGAVRKEFSEWICYNRDWASGERTYLRQ
jgi:hypothetical protein